MKSAALILALVAALCAAQGAQGQYIALLTGENQVCGSLWADTTAPARPLLASDLGGGNSPRARRASEHRGGTSSGAPLSTLSA